MGILRKKLCGLQICKIRNFSRIKVKNDIVYCKKIMEPEKILRLKRTEKPFCMTIDGLPNSVKTIGV